MNVQRRVAIALAATTLVITSSSAVALHADDAPPPTAEQQFASAAADIAARDGITLDLAAQRLAALLAGNRVIEHRPVVLQDFSMERYHHPNPVVDQWHDSAIDAGWNESDWHWLACVIQRESGGWEWVHNAKDPGKGSFGLLQIGSMNLRWLRDRGLVAQLSDLLDPQTNLRAGAALFSAYGKRPWYSKRHPC